MIVRVILAADRSALIALTSIGDGRELLEHFCQPFELIRSDSGELKAEFLPMHPPDDGLVDFNDRFLIRDINGQLDAYAGKDGDEALNMTATDRKIHGCSGAFRYLRGGQRTSKVNRIANATTLVHRDLPG